ncbi:MAG TPA: hypothetical protein VLM91_08970 [Candidatus Methylomirabilis sp.]|nr:hypothetical protein [Candidatus Methylomirabilis sp.]
MAEGTATRSSRRHRTICLPISDEAYPQIVNDPSEFRRTIDDCFRRMPELFPANFAHGYRLKDDRFSVKQEVPIRRVRLRDGTAYSIRPSFLMPYLSARTEKVEGPLFLRTFGVPFWALVHVFGADPMFWYRLECGLGRFSVVGTTVRQAGLPEHLLADEHHQPLDGQKVYIATTVGSGCCLGAEPAEAAGAEELKAAYGTFRDEAHDVTPEYAPETVSTDGWKGTQAAWKALFPTVVILLCFLHSGLKVRDRAKHLKEVFAEISRRVWEAYHAPDRRSFAQRLRRLRQWSMSHLTGVVLENVLDLCGKRDRWSVAYRHPGGHRTSNMLDRIMRGMNRYFDRGQHLHGSRAACRLHCRAWALLSNFAPWHRATTRKNHGWRSPAERLNQHRYDDCWLQNLLISASLGGYRCPLPQNP